MKFLKPLKDRQERRKKRPYKRRGRKISLAGGYLDDRHWFDDCKTLCKTCKNIKLCSQQGLVIGEEEKTFWGKFFFLFPEPHHFFPNLFAAYQFFASKKLICHLKKLWIKIFHLTKAFPFLSYQKGECRKKVWKVDWGVRGERRKTFLKSFLPFSPFMNFFLPTYVGNRAI